MNNRIATCLSYVISTLAVLAVAHFCGAESHFLSIYWPVAFFALAGYDFYQSQVVEDGVSEIPAYCGNGATQKRSLGDNYVDRVIGYIFAAPIILPVRLYRALVR